MQQQRDGFDYFVGLSAQGPQQCGDTVGQERRRAVGQVTVVDRRTAEQRVSPDDVEDHEQDQPGAAGVGAVEPRGTTVLLRFGAQPDHGERDDAQQHRDGEEVLEESEDAPPADHRKVELRIEQDAVGLEVDRGENEEAPHREEVRDPGNRPAQQPGLAEDLARLVSEAFTEVIFATAFIGGRLA